jgi:hypothetical protein
VSSVARASLLNSHSDVLGNRIERKICKNLPKLAAEKSRHHHFLFRVSFFFFFHSPVFFLSLFVPFVFFFLKQHITERRFCIIIEYNGEFCEKRNEALVVLKGTEETFERRLRERSQDREKRSSEKLYVYIIVLLVVELFVKDERGGPETVGSDDQGKSPRLLCVLCCS